LCLHSKGCPRELDGASDAELATLSAGTGVSIKRLREMMTGATMARMSERIREWLLTEEGQKALDQLRVGSVKNLGQPACPWRADRPG